MSAPHDPKHPEPGHRHPPEPALPSKPSASPQAVEEAGTQALSEALRSSFAVVKVIMIILVIVFFASGVFTVPSQEKAIILRFGKPVGVAEKQLLEPGLHWSFPYPIDEVVPIQVGQIHTVTSTAGWYAETPGVEPYAVSQLNPAVDGYTLTGDGNIVHVRALLSYRISDPLAYALNFSNSTNMVQHVIDNAILYASARTPVDEALLDVTAFQEKVLGRVRRLIEEKGLGITLEPSQVRVVPPLYLRTSFQAVQNAGEERRKAVSEAQSQANKSLNLAHSQAASILNSARADKARLLQSVQSEASYFRAQLPYYQSDPQLFIDRIHTEAMHRVLTNQNLDAKWVVPSTPDGRLWLQLSRELEAPSRDDPRQNSASPSGGPR